MAKKKKVSANQEQKNKEKKIRKGWKKQSDQGKKQKGMSS